MNKEAGAGPARVIEQAFTQAADIPALMGFGPPQDGPGSRQRWAAKPGAIYIDMSSGTHWRNAGEAGNPLWQQIGPPAGNC